MCCRERFRAVSGKALSGLGAMAFAALVLLLLAATPLYATQVVLFYDNFDDGNWDGWSLAGIPGRLGGAPDIVPSPQGYSIRGKYTGYADNHTDALIHPLSFIATELTIEMRAKSGSSAPSAAFYQLYSGSSYLTSSYYECADYGESFKRAQFGRIDGPVWSAAYYDGYSIGTQAYEWHDFKWTRDPSGWWSLYIDNQLKWQNFRQDSTLMQFNGVAINPTRNRAIPLTQPPPTCSVGAWPRIIRER